MTEERITFALRQVESGTQVLDVYRQFGIAEATFHVWKKKYANLGVSELRELPPPWDENTRFKRVLADLIMDLRILQRGSQKNI